MKEYITQESQRLEKTTVVPKNLTNVVSWRQEGIKYKKNDVFLDVIEKVNLLVARDGTVLDSEIVGTIEMKVCLSGMPELKLGLNDKVRFDMGDHKLDGPKNSNNIDLEDVHFHQCVRLATFDNDKTISFIPPDGQFDLMSYRLHTQVRPLIWVEVTTNRKATSIDYFVKAKSNFKSHSTATDVEIFGPAAFRRRHAAVQRESVRGVTARRRWEPSPTCPTRTVSCGRSSSSMACASITCARTSDSRRCSGTMAWGLGSGVRRSSRTTTRCDPSR